MYCLFFIYPTPSFFRFFLSPFFFFHHHPHPFLLNTPSLSLSESLSLNFPSFLSSLIFLLLSSPLQYSFLTLNSSSLLSSCILYSSLFYRFFSLFSPLVFSCFLLSSLLFPIQLSFRSYPSITKDRSSGLRGENTYFLIFYLLIICFSFQSYVVYYYQQPRA